MNVRSFLDTNVLVYSDDDDEPEKKAQALDLIASARLSGWGVVSTQVLQEYYSAATRKLGISPEAARRKVVLFSRLSLVSIDLPKILGAIELHQLHKISFWDGLIVRTALDAKCKKLFSEDMQAGRIIEGLEIVNPFVRKG